MTIGKINPVGTCDFEVAGDEEAGTPVEFCGKPAVCEVWFPDDFIPEARYCKQHRPELRELKR